ASVVAAITDQRKTVNQLWRRIERSQSERLSLPTKRQIALDAVRQKAHDTQLCDFLQGHAIRSGIKHISGVGTERIKVLESWGIKTAYDVEYERITAVDGCGPATASSLVRWRDHVVREFRLDAQAIPLEEILEVERLHAEHEARLDQEIRQVLDKMRSIHQATQEELAAFALKLRANATYVAESWTAIRTQVAHLKKSSVAVALSAFMAPGLFLLIRHTMDK
ncbi:MAG: hypothetical protein ABI619_09180, partial [Betaproteobacteria bacterium]